MSTLDDWITDAAAELNLPADSITRELRDGLLDLTRDVAHGVTRVAGPLTTYLVGLAVGAGMPPKAAIETVAALAGSRDADSSSNSGADADSDSNSDSNSGSNSDSNSGSNSGESA